MCVCVRRGGGGGGGAKRRYKVEVILKRGGGATFLRSRNRPLILFIDCHDLNRKLFSKLDRQAEIYEDRDELRYS